MITPVVTIPYNGSLYNLDYCTVVLKSSTGGCKLELIDMTDELNNIICGTFENINNGIQVCEWNNFNNLKNEMSVLQIRGQADRTQILAVELNMSRK